MDQFDLFGNKIETPAKAVKKPKKVAKETTVVANEKETARQEEPTIEKNEGLAQSKKTPEKKPEPKVEVKPTAVVVPEDKVDEKELTKVYYTISEVAKMFDVNASLLRFWEKEFSQLGKIKKNKKGDRYYNKHNIRHLNIIYYLLKVQKMTIAGARDMIKNKQKSTIAKFDIVDNLQQIKGFLVDMKTALQEDKS